MNQMLAPIFPGDVARLRRLGDLLGFIAELPLAGAVVLVAGRGDEHELSDLILQYRGTRMLEATKILVCKTEEDERRGAIIGASTSTVFAAPGFEPRQAVCCNRGRSRAASPLHPNAYFPPQVERAREPVPGALRHAWPTRPPEPAATADTPPATTEAPKFGVSLVVGGPWGKAQVQERPAASVVVVCHTCPDSTMPFRMYADLPSGIRRHSSHATQGEADAALPAFVRSVREAIIAHRNVERTVSRLAA